MRLTFEIWLTSCLAGACLVQICLAALPTNGAHDLDDFAAQEQQAVAPLGGKSSPPHGNRLFNRAIRGPQLNGAATRSNPLLKSQTSQPKSTSTAAPQAEPEREDDENAAALKSDSEDAEAQPKEEAPSSTPSSTEPTRKPFGGVVRPFRSNKDLLDSLKRRRQMQQSHGYTVVPPTAPSSTSERLTNKNTQTPTRKNGSSNKHSPNFSTDQAGAGSYSQKKSTSSRRYNSKPIISSSTNPTTVNNDAITDESNAVSQTTRGRTYPKTRRIS